MSEFISSTGNLGYDTRDGERFYGNHPEAVTAANAERFLLSTFRVLGLAGNLIDSRSVTRAVVRAVVDRQSFDYLTQPYTLVDCLEAVAPLPTTGTEQGAYVAYFARNANGRGAGMTPALKERASLIRDTFPSIRELPGNLAVVRQVQDPRQLHGLWEPTFGWTKQGCEQFAETINGQRSMKPHRRTVWFSGVEDRENHRLVAATMAERLDMPSSVPSHAGHVALTELTELVVAEENRNQGLAGHVIRSLAASVYEDLKPVAHVLFGEFNTATDADYSAARAGMVVPLVETPQGLAPQVLVDNLSIGDGQEPACAYRSFTLMTMPEAQS